jgi:HEAT repeat protein
MVLRAESPDVQVKALEALGVNGSPEALRVTYKILVDTERDPEVIYAATLSVLELAGEATLPYIITALRDSHGAMRQQILRGLFHATNYLKIDLAHSNHTAELFDVLAFCLRDPMSQVREAVAWILAWTRHTAAQDLLAQAYTHETDPSTKAQIEHITASLSAVAV